MDNCALSGKSGNEPKSSRYSIIFEINLLFIKSSLDKMDRLRASIIRLATFSPNPGTAINELGSMYHLQ